MRVRRYYGGCDGAGADCHDQECHVQYVPVSCTEDDVSYLLSRLHGEPLRIRSVLTPCPNTGELGHHVLPLNLGGVMDG